MKRSAIHRSHMLAIGLVGLAVFLYLRGGYSTYKSKILERRLAEIVRAFKSKVVDPNNLKVDAPSAFGLKPEWWHDQTVMLPTTTPAGKKLFFRVFLKHSWWDVPVARVEVAARGHDPRFSKEVRPFGIEEFQEETSLKNVPPGLVSGETLVDLKRWMPGSFEENPTPWPPVGRTLKYRSNIAEALERYHDRYQKPRND